MKFLLKTLIILAICSIQALSYGVEVIDVENHPQDSFPKIVISVGDKKIEYYSSGEPGDISFIKEEKTIKGELPLNGYIFAKEFVESFRIPNTIANKKTKAQFVQIFSENNPGKMVEFLMSVNEKKRTAETDAELEKIEKLIKQANTDDDPATTAYFSTGYIEIKDPGANNERYFIKASDISKQNMKLSADKTKIDLLKSVSVYSFQNVLSGLNFGDIEKGSQEERLYEKMEQVSLTICSTNCQTTPGKSLESFAMNTGKIVSFEVVGNSKIADMDDFNKYVLAQQWCLLKNFSNACSNDSFKSGVDELGRSLIIKGLIQKHGSPDKLCDFLKK